MKVVIGSNFGDEGKGLMTNYFAENVVCRFNGGAQAGHTVVYNSRRHVFHHFGSGTLKRASSYLDKDFLLNPLLFKTEFEQLKGMGLNPVVKAHPNCLVTLPIDMVLNQFMEETKQHGTCGVGIHETMLRSKTCPIYFHNLKNVTGEYIFSLYDRYLASLNIKLNEKTSKLLYNPLLNQAFLEAVEEFYNYVEMSEIDFDDSWVFEGAQGLMLDENHKFFPHVTHSKTGPYNIDSYLSEKDEVCYVTRTYMTRHGNGPFPSFMPDLKFPDLTNHPNPWQGTMRFGAFDYFLWKEAIQDNLPSKAKISLAITHLNEVEKVPVFYKNEKIIEFPKESFIHLLSTAFPFSKIYLSNSETSVFEL